ncbi:glycosyltransferase [Luteimonas gilva]|uniref:Glycosyltransferase n=1 Tax=Luteimonas gilva TaxID=2572684 RepID=A0A4U5JTJ9_9GAMM|nr:glycosyltransferase [Luteimonas gilva]TKR29719.1 glycosyltransferase [Luteimonas gilva]
MSKVTIIDMQPITPAVGGGRQRLLGLYHALGPDMHATYVGTYDWRGEAPRDQMLTPNLREVLVPLSEAHHASAEALADRMEGRVMIDIAFADQVHLSPAFLDVARRHIEEADIVVFSHPWAYPALREAVDRRQLLVYDSHNVESVLRLSLHEDLPQAAQLLRRAVECELQLCRDADLIVACSHEDRETFARIYEVPWSKLRIAVNGIFSFAVGATGPDEKRRAREELGLGDRPVVVFLGSDYGPNNAAAAYIADELAAAVPRADYALIGSCCQALDGRSRSNVRLLGVLGEEDKRRWMRAADVAVNPLDAGSGTSIKMFDFMSASLPVVTTPIGARGIVSPGEPPFVACAMADIPRTLNGLLDDAGRRASIGEKARKVVEDFYSWERISPDLGRLLQKFLSQRQREKPRFSVVVPTYERHHLLDALAACLEAQEEKDFEVIVVDQSRERWPGADAAYGFDLHYVKSEVKGAVHARNTGGRLATGACIAYTDDDCEPTPQWLANAGKWLADPTVVGVEGLVRSEHVGDPEWRAVTNVGFEGVGFMTANLFVKNDVFQRLDGFDLSFDNPHFREDTDFGWRMQTEGGVPYAADVEVFHPAHRRDIERESQAERNRFFEKDALLLSKHPERYRQLFLAEAHFLNTAGFWDHLARGAEKYRVSLPAWLDEYKAS